MYLPDDLHDELMPTRSRDGSATGASVGPADVLILASGGFSRSSSRTKQALAIIRSLTNEGLWPPIVPTVVLVESFHGTVLTDDKADIEALATHARGVSVELV